jgi:aminoglycoside phosphotransferase (APT) family kinase protein
VVHGDARPCNTVTEPSGLVRLIDFERVGRGNTDWDCALVWTACNRMGDGDWQAFCDGYGDSRLCAWTEATPMVQLAMIWAFSWCCGRDDELPEAWHDEMLHRFQQRRRGKCDVRWNSL